jgi:3',5'-cyclic AMP phosphodiesterase CpdA
VANVSWTTLALLCVSALAQDPATPPAATSWKFAVSGDSRNCGDIVMPAIASGALQSGAEFYWHLGDFRAIYTFDEDIIPPAKLKLPSKPMVISDYLAAAWPDFIAHQLTPFGDLPIFLAMGNHETIPPATRDAWLIQFADWLESPAIRAQRLKDNPQDRKLRAYYHWVKSSVDFISLDNASTDQFDSAQLDWLLSLIQRDEASPDIRTIVVGMHAALPGSIGHSHSMSDWAQGDKTGRQVYQKLWHAQDSAHKRVYILASHSHFFMEDVYHTADWKNKVLPGWIVGTAGAVRYRLPSEAGPAQKAQTDVYGYMIGTVATDGSVAFEFQKLSVDDLLAASHGSYPEVLVRWCYSENKQ